MVKKKSKTVTRRHNPVTRGLASGHSVSQKVPTIPVKAQDKCVSVFRANHIMTLMSATDLLDITVPQRKKYWGELMGDHQIGMLVGPRGKGKTWYALGLAVAMSTAKEFLGLRSAKPRNVIYLDGEMDLNTLKDRTKLVFKSLGAEPNSNLRFFTPEAFTGMLPSITSLEGQIEIDKLIGEEWQVLIIDNYSAWTGDGRETAESFAPLMRWMLRHKHAGRLIILVHHAGKNGKQRGSSKHEDALDWSIALEPAVAADDQKSLQFVLKWMKCRHLPSEKHQPISVSMGTSPKGVLEWIYESGIKDAAQLAKMKRLRAAGKKNVEIATACSVSESTVSRALSGVH